MENPKVDDLGVAMGSSIEGHIHVVSSVSMTFHHGNCLPRGAGGGKSLAERRQAAGGFSSLKVEKAGPLGSSRGRRGRWEKPTNLDRPRPRRSMLQGTGRSGRKLCSLEVTW